jgi:type II secretory ATPase GspE/PulE/Tfp pilus assembly ATPase PilB-like protein
VRLRVDGVLHERFTLPRGVAPALVSRLKVIAELNIAEKRLPQDGRSRVRVGDRQVVPAAWVAEATADDTDTDPAAHYQY